MVPTVGSCGVVILRLFPTVGSYGVVGRHTAFSYGVMILNPLLKPPAPTVLGVLQGRHAIGPPHGSNPEPRKPNFEPETRDLIAASTYDENAVG